ncbi:MAG: glycoside hydrolase family 5 protein [Tepidisphaerales bacterium]
MTAWLAVVLMLLLAAAPTAPTPPTAAGPETSSSGGAAGRTSLPPLPAEPFTPLSARAAVAAMTPGINIGNTLENTTHWETGWGNPPITREYVQTLARLGFKTVRLPVAWDTYADGGRITPQQFARVAEVVNWITDAGMFCVLNIHWDGGWIDSSWAEKFPTDRHRFSPEAEIKFRSYWSQIATFFAGKSERLVFEALNEETNFEGEGSPETAYATLLRVNQLFIDTVRATGGHNAQRLLIVPGYKTDIQATLHPLYRLPADTVPDRLMLSIHYYTPWTFVGLERDAPWGRMRPTWGTEDDVAELTRLFDALAEYARRQDIPVFLGEFAVASRKERESTLRWTKAVLEAAVSRGMVPVLWDTGSAVSRRAPYAPDEELIGLFHAARPAESPSPRP